MHLTVISNRYSAEQEVFDNPGDLMKQIADLDYAPLERAEALCDCGEYVTIYKATDTVEMVAVQNPHQNHRAW
jgi:hypothetical protein